MSYDRAALEDSIRDWVATATGAPTARVYWAGDDGARPAGAELAVSLALSPRAGRGGFALVTTEPTPLSYASRGYSISGGALQVTAHGLVAGDGPFAVAGAVAGSYWVTTPSADALGLAADFFAARAGTVIALPGSGSGTIASGPSTVAYGAPASRSRSRVVTLELRVEARGGTSTGATSPGYVLEQLRGDVDALRCPLAVTVLGPVVLAPTTIGKVRIEPTAIWTCEVEISSLDSEPSYVIERVGDPSVIA